MSDKPKTQDVDEPEVEDDNVETPETKEPDPQGKQGKTYSQEQLDKIVQNRLRRERENSKSVNDALTADVSFYEEQMAKVVEAQITDWDEGMKSLFKALPVKEQLQKLADEEFMAKVHRKNIPPKTPTESGDGTVSFKHKISRI